MSTTGPNIDDAVRAMLLLMPRLVGRGKRMKVPAEVRTLSLAPRHLSLFAYLLFDGELSVNELAERLELAPTTVSLMVGELTRKGVLDRREDPDDRRRKLVSIVPERRPAIDEWLGRGAEAWRAALEPLKPAERKVFLDTLTAYLQAIGEDE